MIGTSVHIHLHMYTNVGRLLKRITSYACLSHPYIESQLTPLMLGTLQLRALGFLNSVFPLDEPRLTYLDHRAALGQHSPMLS